MCRVAEKEGGEAYCRPCKNEYQRERSRRLRQEARDARARVMEQHEAQMVEYRLRYQSMQDDDLDFLVHGSDGPPPPGEQGP
jgi:hypothetical protein